MYSNRTIHRTYAQKDTSENDFKLIGFKPSCREKRNTRARYIEFNDLQDTIKRNLMTGYGAEDAIAKHCKCPECNGHLIRLSTNSPCVDLICEQCSLQIEVKSRCMSNQQLPDDIRVMASREDVLRRCINKGTLNIALLIYKIDDTLTTSKFEEKLVRGVYFIPNKAFNDSNLITFESSSKSSKTIVTIKNIQKFRELPKNTDDNIDSDIRFYNNIE